MMTILYVVIGAVIAASGSLQWFKDFEKNLNKNTSKTKHSVLSLILAIIFGTMLFFMFKGYMLTELDVIENLWFLPYWISLILALLQFFYELIIQNIKEYTKAFLEKFLK